MSLATLGDIRFQCGTEWNPVELFFCMAWFNKLYQFQILKSVDEILACKIRDEWKSLGNTLLR